MELVNTHHSPIRLFSLCLLYNGIYWLYTFSLQEKFLTIDELAEMPSCNLTKTIHNKSLQASRNKGDDLYIAVVDYYI